MDSKMKDLSTTATDVKKDPTAATAAVTAVESSTAQQGNDETNQALPATDTAPAEQDMVMTAEENRNNNNNNDKEKDANDSSLSSRKKRSMEETKAASAMETEANVTSNEAPASKRPRTETTTTTTTASLNKDNNNEDDPSQEQQQQLPVISYLLEHGKAGPNGKVQPTQLKMTMTPAPGQELEEGIPNMIRLLVGDDVMVFQGNDDDEDKPSSKRLWPPAKIQSFSERGGTVFFTAQWYLNKHDIAQLPLHVPWKGPLTRQELMERILQKDTDVVLSNQTDENEIGAIYGMARVQLEGDQHHQPVANHDIYHCRYQLEVKPNEMILTPYAASDVASVATHSTTTAVSDKKKTAAKPPPKPSVSNLSKTPDNSESEEESEDDDDGPRGGRASGRAGAVAEGEGSILRESIEVGPEHQAEVPPFVPNTPPPRSRGPKLVWKQGQFSDAQLAAYLHGVAAQHTPFLDRHGLSQPVAYTPVLNPDQVDALLDYRGPERLTGSSLSSAAQMAQMADPQGRPRVCLRKECDPDVLLEILTDCGGRVEEAVEVATSDLQRITSSAWTASQRARYDDGFRKHSGALRKIAKALAPQKSMQDVVDYHFRTKIPNQFRQFFEKKRETAVRIIEVMEEKKTVQVMAQASLSVEDDDNNNNDDNEELSRRSRSPVPPAQQQQQHWNETSVHDVANQGVSEGRRRKARELMLDVQELLGHDILAEVADRIRELNQEYTTEARKGLLAVLQGHADLQKRFVDFLPKAPN